MNIKKMLFMGCAVASLMLFALATQAKSLTEAEKAVDMGVRYLFGRGVPQSDNHAFYYFDQAAKDGSAFAENELGFMYATGKGIEANKKQAFFYYSKAARHGLSSAEYNVGLLYLTGFGVKKDKPLALAWFKRSAEHGFLPAVAMLKQPAVTNAKSTV